MSKKTDIDALQTVVLMAGIYEGLLPFVSKIFDWQPVLALPLRLDAPWWWLVSSIVVVVACVLLVALDNHKVSLVKAAAPDVTDDHSPVDSTDARGTPGR